MSEQTSEEQPEVAPDDAYGDDEELAGMVSSIRRSERRQRVRVALYAAAVVVVAAVVVYAFFTYRDEFFVPKVDMDEAGKVAWEKTNDPQCRTMIEDVTVIGEDFREYESFVEENVLGDDPDDIREIKSRMEAFKARLNKAEELSEKAELRYQDSADQLDDWFDYVDTEIGFVERLADERLAQLERESAAQGSDATSGESSSESDVGGIVVHSPDASVDKAGDDDKPEKTPRERRDGALVALDSAFQSFRVWHSANAHPCGAAADDEQPWRPEEGAGSSDATDQDAPSE